MSHPLVTQLRDGDPAARRAACAAIPADPSAVLLLEPLQDALSDAEPAVRRAASEALAQLGREAAEVDRLLLDTLRGDEPRSRFEAARAMAELAPPGPRLIPALVEALGSERRETAWEAARILVDAGRLHEEVVPIVIGLVRAGPSHGARCMALACLRELAPEHPDALTAVLEASKDADAALRRAAFTTLPSFGATGADVQTRLADAAESDPDPSARTLASRALEILRAENAT